MGIGYFCPAGLYGPIHAFTSPAKQFIQVKDEMEVLVYQ
jgi:hypothetical protein